MLSKALCEMKPLSSIAFCWLRFFSAHTSCAFARRHIRFARRDLGADLGEVDPRQHLALLHAFAFAHRDRDQFAGDLGLDRGLGERHQRAGERQRALQGARLDDVEVVLQEFGDRLRLAARLAVGALAAHRGDSRRAASTTTSGGECVNLHALAFHGSVPWRGRARSMSRCASR